MAGFDGSLGWGLDAGRAAGDSFRIVQLTPPGSECSARDNHAGQMAYWATASDSLRRFGCV